LIFLGEGSKLWTAKCQLAVSQRIVRKNCDLIVEAIWENGSLDSTVEEAIVELNGGYLDSLEDGLSFFRLTQREVAKAYG
jgi:hypothetical protein